MNKHLLLCCLAAALIPSFANAQTQARLDGGKFVSNEEITVQRLNCNGTSVQFARGVRWAPADYSPIVSINDSATVQLHPSCYTNMMCGHFNGKPAVVIVDAPACGGNAVGEDYIVIDLASRRKHVLSYTQARQAKLIR
jgi:hypothetical protein